MAGSGRHFSIHHLYDLFENAHWSDRVKKCVSDLTGKL